MDTLRWFDDPVAGTLPAEEAASALRQVGENEIAEALEEKQEKTSPIFRLDTRKRWWALPEKPWVLP